MIIISVVRDFAMYDELVRANPVNSGSQFVVFDNTTTNIPIPVRYNSFLNTFNYSNEDWFVFCHEDFELLASLKEKVQYLDKTYIYGTIGATLHDPGIGLMIVSDKDGSHAEFRGQEITAPKLVDTIDCVCIIIHSSLVKKLDLRFDNNLTYDLYAEDFVINAYEKYNVLTKILPIRSHHYSYGNITAAFYEQLKYLNNKYKDAKRIYATSTSFAIGNEALLAGATETIHSKYRIPLKWLFYKKISHKGNLVIKLFGLPIWNKNKYKLYEWQHGAQCHKVTFVSVVRDFSMYDKLVKSNPNNAGATFINFDNTKENQAITTRYNAFLNTFDYSKPSWLVFCHEDFSFLEPLGNQLPKLDKGCIYGTFGVRSKLKGFQYIGCQLNSCRDNSKLRFIGYPINREIICDTVDCECLIIHSSLICKYNLRFDEHLSFDLYAEEFCIKAKEQYSIKTKVFPIKTHHYSWGNINDRFYAQYKYLQNKFAHSTNIYYTSVGGIIGNNHIAGFLAETPKRRNFNPIKTKLTGSGNLLIKFFGICIYCKKISDYYKWQQEPN